MLLGLFEIYKKEETQRFRQKTTRHERREDDVYSIFERLEKKRCNYLIEKEKRNLRRPEAEG